MKLNPEFAKILAPAYPRCSSFSGACSSMRWNPEQGHVPRGFLGAVGNLKEIELVLVFAEPGDPAEGERSSTLASTYSLVTRGFQGRGDQFHQNVFRILDSCWPKLTFEQQLRKVWMTESVLCSATVTTGPVSRSVTKECGQRYLLEQLKQIPSALVVALGSKARQRLKVIGVTDFLPAFSVAPPGCNFSGACESWDRIPRELKRRMR